MGANPSQPVLMQLHADQLWAIRGKQKFFCIEMGGFGMIARLPDQTLAVVNPVQLTPTLLGKVKELEESTGCKLAIIFSPGDWHHIHIKDWMEAFPASAVHVVSPRVVKKLQPLSQHDQARLTVLDQKSPGISSLSEVFTLVPWLGCKQPIALVGGGDKAGDDRVEVLAFHQPSFTLFVTDFLFAPSNPNQPKLSHNGPGFRVKTPAEARQSVERVLALGAKNLVFSHGTMTNYYISDHQLGESTCDAILRKAYGSFVSAKASGGDNVVMVQNKQGV